ncbi:MAG: class I SAM-dependent methyltransferase [Acidimicrobiales bacterium]
MPAATIQLRDDRGDVLTLEPARWHGPVTAAERALLATLRGPVLDVGCGPGRIVEAAIRIGVVALGVDPAPAAVALARERGCPVLQRSVFDPVPGEGRWGSALLWDGNIGIGGDPVQLLRRCRGLVRAEGRIIVELEPPGTRSRRCRARLERGEQASGWFGWSVVGTDAIAALAADAGLITDAISIVADGRWFAPLSRAEDHAPD